MAARTQGTRPIELVVYAAAAVYIALFAYSIVEPTETTTFLADMAFGVVIAVWGVDLLTAGGGQRLTAAGGALLAGGVLQAGVTVVGVTGVLRDAPVVLVLAGVVLYISDQSGAGAGR